MPDPLVTEVHLNDIWRDRIKKEEKALFGPKNQRKEEKRLYGSHFTHHYIGTDNHTLTRSEYQTAVDANIEPKTDTMAYFELPP